MVYPAIFLDRDGVIIENRLTYIRSWADVSIYPQALTALAGVNHSPYKIIIITNQSAVGQGLIPLDVAKAINAQLVSEIKRAGGRVDGVFMCPHTPEDDCMCRKPKPGLLLQAAQTFSLDLARSVVIGDALTDILAGQAAGVQHNILVRTGRGLAQSKLPEAADVQPFLIYDTLAEALASIA